MQKKTRGNDNQICMQRRPPLTAFWVVDRAPEAGGSAVHSCSTIWYWAGAVCQILTFCTNIQFVFITIPYFGYNNFSLQRWKERTGSYNINFQKQQVQKYLKSLSLSEASAVDQMMNANNSIWIYRTHELRPIVKLLLQMFAQTICIYASCNGNVLVSQMQPFICYSLPSVPFKCREYVKLLIRIFILFQQIKKIKRKFIFIQSIKKCSCKMYMCRVVRL